MVKEYIIVIKENLAEKRSENGFRHQGVGEDRGVEVGFTFINHSSSFYQPVGIR